MRGRTIPRSGRAAGLTLAACVALLAACSKSEPPAPPAAPPPAPNAAPAPPPTAPPAAAAPAAVAPAPFAVTGIELGRAIDDGKKIASPTTEFAPGDTIHVVVASSGKSNAVTIKARWTYGDDGQLVTEQSENVAPTGPANTEFHISRPSGWPAGTYKVEISVDGAPAGSKTFTVK